MGNLCCCCEGSCCSDITIIPWRSRHKQRVTKIHVRQINSACSAEEINEGLPEVLVEELPRDKSMNKAQPISKMTSEANEHCPSESSCSDDTTIKEELLKILGNNTESGDGFSLKSSEEYPNEEEALEDNVSVSSSKRTYILHMSMDSLYLESIGSSEGFSELEEEEEFHQGLQANQAGPKLATDVCEKQHEDKRTDIKNLGSSPIQPPTGHSHPQLGI
ncbi:uncharacterized protein [Dipodomys merriami]|uniref:uncharacterized protein isoform X2 n=1 Tax=Dipodomys merriami TaxID=94247 RepID=UPI003855ACD1